jgi:hypothetical protein
MQQTCIMNAWNKRGRGSENFGVKITKITKIGSKDMDE